VVKLIIIVIRERMPGVSSEGTGMKNGCSSDPGMTAVSNRGIGMADISSCGTR